jgi:UPF0716 family protein affecting phage T7 exclusion
MVTTKIASSIGGLATFLAIIFTAGVGFFIISSFKYTAAQGMSMLMNGQITMEEFQKMSLFTLIGAMLLIIPGFFSDILGILLQFSFFGTFIARNVLKLKNKNKSKKNKNKNMESKDEAIDVEIIDVDIIE